ncbi:MAG: hypothetical protein QOE08_913 [Thermoleophilaceae bacterium]|nr:hypothetical protein [Thermoleophilaceae bacterium]
MRSLALLAGWCAVAMSGCGDDAAPPPGRAMTAETASVKPPAKRNLRRAHCPRALVNCRTATGSVIYVEAVDPDGDGDAHFVLASGDGITSAGISVIDVERALRPKRLPSLGDEVAAAGPVYRGSYGQRQIQAIELHLARR